ncbi:MAG: c-type cytochrome [Candidatus Marinimicrobia bacterium]|nr:c-type cytochrome [Candidatus Neomarinimicrobiota bacterium]MCF7850035.1 c-type cytochrome [Candidatus Neomarinimicrobiota bacterium]
MKRLGLMILALSLGLLVIQCGGGEKEKASAESAAPAAESAAPATESSMAADYEYDLANGEAVYKKYCFACHDAGLAGAAKHADQERWAESAAKGIPTLITHATEGYQGQYGVLPPMGTCMDCSEQDIIDAVHYQLSMGGAL